MDIILRKLDNMNLVLTLWILSLLSCGLGFYVGLKWTEKE